MATVSLTRLAKIYPGISYVRESDICVELFRLSHKSAPSEAQCGRLLSLLEQHRTNLKRLEPAAALYFELISRGDRRLLIIFREATGQVSMLSRWEWSLWTESVTHRKVVPQDLLRLYLESSKTVGVPGCQPVSCCLIDQAGIESVFLAIRLKQKSLAGYKVHYTAADSPCLSSREPSAMLVWSTATGLESHLLRYSTLGATYSFANVIAMQAASCLAVSTRVLFGCNQPQDPGHTVVGLFGLAAGASLPLRKYLVLLQHFTLSAPPWAKVWRIELPPTLEEVETFCLAWRIHMKLGQVPDSVALTFVVRNEAAMTLCRYCLSERPSPQELAELLPGTMNLPRLALHYEWTGALINWQKDKSNLAAADAYRTKRRAFKQAHEGVEADRLDKYMNAVEERLIKRCEADRLVHLLMQHYPSGTSADALRPLSALEQLDKRVKMRQKEVEACLRLEEAIAKYSRQFAEESLPLRCENRLGTLSDEALSAHKKGLETTLNSLRQDSAYVKALWGNRYQSQIPTHNFVEWTYCFAPAMFQGVTQFDTPADIIRALAIAQMATQPAWSSFLSSVETIEGMPIELAREELRRCRSGILGCVYVAKFPLIPEIELPSAAISTLTATRGDLHDASASLSLLRSSTVYRHSPQKDSLDATLDMMENWLGTKGVLCKPEGDVASAEAAWALVEEDSTFYGRPQIRLFLDLLARIAHCCEHAKELGIGLGSIDRAFLILVGESESFVGSCQAGNTKRLLDVYTALVASKPVRAMVEAFITAKIQEDFQKVMAAFAQCDDERADIAEQSSHYAAAGHFYRRLMAGEVITDEVLAEAALDLSSRSYCHNPVHLRLCIDSLQKTSDKNVASFVDSFELFLEEECRKLIQQEADAELRALLEDLGMTSDFITTRLLYTDDYGWNLKALSVAIPEFAYKVLEREGYLLS